MLRAENLGLSGQEGEAGQREERGGLEKQVKATAPGLNLHGILSSQEPSQERWVFHLRFIGEETEAQEG